MCPPHIGCNHLPSPTPSLALSVNYMFSFLPILLLVSKLQESSANNGLKSKTHAAGVIPEKPDIKGCGQENEVYGCYQHFFPEATSWIPTQERLFLPVSRSTSPQHGSQGSVSLQEAMFALVLPLAQRRQHFLPVWSELQAEFQAWEEMTSY